MALKDVKVFMCGILAGCLGISTAFAAGGLQAQRSEAHILLDGQPLELRDVVSITADESESALLYVPVRDLFEKMGYSVDWVRESKTVNIHKNNVDNKANESASGEMSEAMLPEASRINVNGLNIEVNPAVELLSIVQYISSYDEKFGLMTYEDFTYKQDIEKHFRQYSDHETVKMLEQLIENGFTFDRPPGAMLLMNPDFSLDRQSYEQAANERVAIPNLQEFFNALRKFSADSDFNSFYNEHKEYYQRILRSTADKMPKGKIIDRLESFFGKKMGSYNVILVSVYHNGGFGPSIDREERTDVYSIIGPSGTDNNNPTFGSTDGFEYLQLHEFGHSFIELDTNEIMPLVKESEYLFAPIEEKMAKMAYPQWETALEEIILRATTVKIQREDNSQEAKDHLKRESDEGFIYIDTVYSSLMKYEKDRGKYPDFQSFLPVIIEDLMSAKRH